MLFFLHHRAVPKWVQWISEVKRMSSPKAGWLSGKELMCSPLSPPNIVLPPHVLCFHYVELTLEMLQACTLAEAQRAKWNTLGKATGPWSPGNARRHRAVRRVRMDILIISCICGRPALWHAKQNWEQKHQWLMKQNKNKTKTNSKAEGKRTQNRQV
jgi:hypothetical protein